MPTATAVQTEEEIDQLEDEEQEIEDGETVTRDTGEHVNVAGLIEPGKTKDLGNGVVEVIVSTGSVDRHMEKIEVAGVDLKAFKKNPIVLYGHDYASLPIGKATSIKKVNDQIVAKVQFATEEYAFAKTVYDLIKGGYINDVSIGGIVQQWNQDYTVIEKMEMVEFSVVNIGANRDAKIIQRSLGKTSKQIRDEYADFAAKQLSERVKNLDKDELGEAIKSLKKLIAVLEASHEEAQNVSASEDVKTIKRFTLKKAAQEVDKGAEKVIRLIKTVESA